MFNSNFEVTKRINRNADCMTVFNDEGRNLVELLTHKNPHTYKHFPKYQVVGVWKIKSKKL